MKILLDECLPRKLIDSLAGHEAITVPQAGLAGLQNGELIAALKSKGFDIFLTIDANITYQQNLSKAGVRIVVLKCKSNKLEDIKVLVPKLMKVLNSKIEDQVSIVED